MDDKKLLREVETEEFYDETLEEETELFERKEKLAKENVILG
jgi:hypothetical protein